MKMTDGQIKYGLGKCISCNRLKPLIEFRQWDYCGPHRAEQCFKCEKKTPFTARSAVLGRGPAWHRKRELIQDAKKKPCHDCGNKFPSYCMEFDHLPEFEKEHNIASMMDRREEVIIAEIAKCDVVCVCCHRIRTHERGYIGVGRKPTNLAGSSE